MSALGGHSRSMKARSVHSRGMNTRSVDMLGMQPLQTSTLGVRLRIRLRPRLSLRYRRGAGALVAVLLLAALAGTGLAVHYAAQHAARQTVLAFEAGRVFGAWVLAAHRATQEHDFAPRLSVEPAFVLAPAVLRGMGAVPPGLPAHAGRHGGTPRYASFTVGIMDDGRGGPGRAPVAMAFGVLEPARAEAAPALRQGAIAAGLAALAEAGTAGTAMTVHVPAIESALGRPLAPDAFYVTADSGLRYRDQTLYRRPQPGRPELNRMETALDAGGHDVTDVAAAEGFAASVSKEAQAGGAGSVTGDTASARLEAGSLEAGGLGAASLTVSAELLVGRAAAGPVLAGTAAVTGRLEAASLSAAGRLTAGTLAAAGTTEIAGPSSAQSLAGEMLSVSGGMSAGRIASTGLHGPDASIGALTVGSCGGC